VKRGKRSQPPAPRAGIPARWKEPTKAELGSLRQLLSEHREKPLPPRLQDTLFFVLFWAAWQIGRPWDRERIRYQRWCAVDEGIERGLKFEEALAYAVKKLAPEPSWGGIGVMKRDYLIEQGTHGLSRRPRRSPRRDA
jgi:hypothetical protein